jgi:hypothetical protein
MLTPKQLAKTSRLYLVPGKTAPTENRIHQDRSAEFNEHFSPSNPEERSLIDTILTNRSRLHLLRSVEADLWNHAAPAEPSFVKVLRTLAQLETLIHSCQDNYVRALQALQSQETSQPQPSKDTSAAQWLRLGKVRNGSKSQTPVLTPNPPEAA